MRVPAALIFDRIVQQRRDRFVFVAAVFERQRAYREQMRKYGTPILCGSAWHAGEPRRSALLETRP